jgi:Heparinase II/III-like protein/Heparinase II/III N-terminus
MSPAGIAWRLRDRMVRATWSPREAGRYRLAKAVTGPDRTLAFTAVLPPGTAARVPEEARRPVVETADRLLQDRPTGPAWALSRLQHLTLLATAWFLTHDERYARRVAEHLSSCWLENPVLSGTHRVNGAELGIRLSSLAWIRRLLDDWPGTADLFERDALALRQLRRLQQYLAAFPSRGSSADGYVIAEAAGRLVASCAFPWFRESERWRRKSALMLERELRRNAFPSGAGRETTPDYQCVIVELGFVAAVEADASGHPLRPATWARLCALADCAAALVDTSLRPPRRGDSGEGRGLVLDAPTPNNWPSTLALAGALVGQQDWWPQLPVNAMSAIVGAMAGSRRQIGSRPSRRPSHFAEAGITLLRTTGKNEIWCLCDGSLRGHRGIATHARADALSVEVRYAGVDILADPGILCFHGRRAWRSFFRSLIGRTIPESGDPGQPGAGDPFTWAAHAHDRAIEVLDDGDIARWTAEHDGYASLDPPARHRRSVLLDRASRSIDIIDEIDGGSHDISLAFRLGPDVRAELEESCAVLTWPAAPAPGTARLELPVGLRWSLHEGGTDPIGPVPGRAVQSLGRPAPAATLLGCGRCVPGMPLVTRLEFLDVGRSDRSAFPRSAFPRWAVSWTASAALLDRAPDIRAEAI